MNATHATIHRSNDAEKLNRIAAALRAQGFSVGPVVTPENEWVDGVSYFTTNATNRQSDVRKAV